MAAATSEASGPAAAGHDATVPPDARAWRWLRMSPLLPPLALFLVSLAAALRAGMRGTGGHLIYSLDDAYIHMAVAKNLATRGVWGCTPFHFSSSSSSPLWTLVLGIAYRAFGVHDAAPLVVNAGLVLATLVVADRYLARFGASPPLRAAALLGLVVAFPMAAMVLMGMEHILHLLLTLWFAGAAVEALMSGPDDPRAGRRRTLTLCILAALLGAARYEGFFLIALACLGFVLRRQALRCGAVGVAALVPAAAFGVVSVANGAFFLPNSLILKAAGERASALSALFKPWRSEELEFLRNDRALPVLLALGTLGVLWAWHRRRDAWRPHVLFPLFLVGMIVAHGHYVFSPMYWVYRYDAYLVGFGVFVAAVMVADLPTGGGLLRRSVPALLMVPLVAVVASVREGLTAAAEIAGMRNTYLEQYQTALFIRTYHPDEAVIVNDLGAVTYYTQSRILDLAALGDVEPLQIMRRTGGYTSRDVVAWTAKYRPTMAVISMGWSWVAPLIPREWIKVGEVEVPPKRERVGFYAVDPREAWVLRSSMATHFAPLRQVPGYLLKLRNAQRMHELTGDDRAGDAPPSF
jgi:hypothetical protein